MEYKLSYDYSELIQELHEEIADGILKYDDIIQIVRGETIEEMGDYEPIIDWYYNNKCQMDDLKIEIFDDGEDIEMKNKIREQYEKDIQSGKLESCTVNAALVEMEDMNKLI